MIDAGHGIRYAVTIVESAKMNGIHVDFDWSERTCRVRASDDARELLERFGFAERVIASRAKAELAAQRRSELAIEIEQLAPLVDVGTPTASAVRRAFQNAGAIGDGIDDFQASEEALRKARDAFYALPIAELKAVLNGWSPDPARPTVAELCETPAADMEIRRVVTLSLRASTVTADHEFVTDVGSACHPVCVVIQEGASKVDVLRYLADATRIVRDAWSLLVDQDAARTVDHHVDRVLNQVRDGRPLGQAMAACSVASAIGITLPARVMYDGTTTFEPLVKRLIAAGRIDEGTQIITDASVDRNGQAIRVGDTIVESDGGILATRGAAGAGRVLAIAGDAVIYSLGDSKGYSTAQAGGCYVVSTHEKGGASRTPNPPTPASKEREEAKAATTAAA